MTDVILSSGERRRLGAITYRILGSFHDAEDAVQETQIRWARLSVQERSAIREPGAWRTRVASRVALDLLGSARSRRESSNGIWLPEPAPGEYLGGQPVQKDPLETVLFEESVTLALLVAMEALSPAERVALVLHDAFAVPFADIAEILDRSEAAARQLASSARRTLRGRPAFDRPSASRDQVVEAFKAACESGDLDALVAALHRDAVSRADGGAHIVAATRPIVGAQKVARYLLGLLVREQTRTLGLSAEVVEANGYAAVAVFADDAPVALLDLAITNGLVSEIAFIVDQDKLTAIHRQAR